MKKRNRKPLPLPVSFDDLGVPLSIVRRAYDEKHGQFDPRIGEVAIGDHHCAFGERVILIHEAMHVAETMLIESGFMKRRISHAFITAAAYGMAVILYRAGAFPDLTDEDLEAFQRQEEARAAE